MAASPPPPILAPMAPAAAPATVFSPSKANLPDMSEPMDATDSGSPSFQTWTHRYCRPLKNATGRSAAATPAVMTVPAELPFAPTRPRNWYMLVMNTQQTAATTLTSALAQQHPSVCFSALPTARCPLSGANA